MANSLDSFAVLFRQDVLAMAGNDAPFAKTRLCKEYR